MFYVVPYRVLFHDTMAYGTQHFLTNLKFQCEAREHFLFGEVMDRLSSDERREFDDLVFLTRDAFSRNLGAVPVGARVAIVMSIEEPTTLSVRFCFRIFGEDGQPVACGFQTATSTSRRTHRPVTAPVALRRYSSLLRERLTFGDFRSRVLAGDTASIFSTNAAEAAARALRSSEGFVPLVRSAPWEPITRPERLRGSAFLLPGNGSLKWAGFKTILERKLDPARKRRADEIAEDAVGCTLSRLADTASEKEFRGVLGKHAGLEQVATYVESVLGCELLADMGIVPDVIAGHSGGELSALAAGGSYSFEAGLDVVCKSNIALAPLRGVGGMLILSAHTRRVESLIGSVAPSRLEIAIINHAEQTTVAGPPDDIDRLRKLAKHLRIAHLLLPTPYPFHCSLLQPMVKDFARLLGDLTTGDSWVPIYSPLEQDFAAPARIAENVPLHFVRPLDYREAILRLHDLGVETFVDCSTGGTLKGVVNEVLASRPNWTTAHPFKDLARLGTVSAFPAPSFLASANVPDAGEEPIAVVGLGCVLPGARNPDELWTNVVNGVVSIVDVVESAPLDAADFVAHGKVVSDKSYSSLTGQVDAGADLSGEPEMLGERILSNAIAQAMTRVHRADDARTLLFIGSTADGYVEFDEGLVGAGILEAIKGSGRTGPLANAVEALFARAVELVPLHTPSAVLGRVATRMFGPGTRAVAVDAACASSLYAIQLGIERLREREHDLAICGGVFAPGPASGCLFSQFGGLSATASRPFDAAADGVVFCPGAAILALKRLSDALRDGDKIEAVIRGCGTSSDGRGASIIEPKKDGQLLAVKRAYADARLKPASVQYVEAHATATRVGDAIEFSALREAFAGGDEPISIGSIKSMIGHTGWSAGAASAVKVCQALKHAKVPPQAAYTNPSPDIHLKGSPFEIPANLLPWRHGATPRRAGVNAFGFGGANSHLIIEAFDPEIHRADSGRAVVNAEHDDVVIVGFHASDTGRGQLAFTDTELKLPDRPRVLPDIAKDMDRSQIMAVMAAERVLGQLGDNWQSWRDEIGVIFGFEGKTANALKITKRLYLDRVARQLSEQLGLSTEAQAEIELLASEVRAATTPSGPYTLPGLMPNLVSGRVANMFDLRGANLVVDAAGASIACALEIAAAKVRRGESKVILAGGISANPLPAAELMTQQHWRHGRPVRESAIVLALARADFAQHAGLTPIARLECDKFSEAPGDELPVGSAPEYLMGAEGAHEIGKALTAAGGKKVTTVAWPLPSGESIRLRFAPVAERSAATTSGIGRSSGKGIDYCSISLRPEPKPAGKTEVLSERRVIVVCDQPEALDLAETPNWIFVTPPGATIAGSVPLDPFDDESLTRGLADRLAGASLNSIGSVILARDVSRSTPDELVAPPGGLATTFDLFIAITRLLHGSIEAGETNLLALCSNAWSDSALHPWTGLCGGALKSIARELPKAKCRAVHTDEPLGATALEQLQSEIGDDLRSDVEVAYRRRIRHVPRLVRTTPSAAHETGVPLEDDAVVLATGGARGITAKFVEAILERKRCRVVLLGRAPLSELPATWQDADEASLPPLEREFYATALANRPSGGIKVARQRFNQLRDAWEVHANLKLFASHGLAVEYIQADVTDADQIDAAFGRVSDLFGRLDMIIHGAGIQDSRPLKTKSLADFRRVLATKIDGAFNLQRACAKHFPGRRVHYHLVTSSFSFFGNDGQADYGAANEMMNRLVEWHHANGEPWSALAWLGWAGVGMTRGTEFRPLAERRGLTPIFADEGKALFANFLSNPGYHPVSVLVSEGEKRFYGIEVMEGIKPSGEASTLDAVPVRTVVKKVTPKDYGVADHLVNGVPVLPGAIALDMAVNSAANGRSDSLSIVITDLEFEKFLRLPNGRSKELEIDVSAVPETSDYRVEVKSSFVHSSGLVLRPDLLHCRCNVRFAPDNSELDFHIAPTNDAGDHALLDEDPYGNPESPILLRGPFRCLTDIRLSKDTQTATFLSSDPAPRSEGNGPAIPWLLLDALARVSMLHTDADGNLPVGAAMRASHISIAAGVSYESLMGQKICLQAARPRYVGDLMVSQYAKAIASDGRVVVAIRDLVAKRIGVVTRKAPGKPDVPLRERATVE